MFLLMLAMLDDDERQHFARIFEQYGKKMYEIAFSIVKNHHDAEDVVEDVMVSIIKNGDKFVHCDGNEIAAQIVIYTRNSAINIYNKNKRRAVRSESLSYTDGEGEESERELCDASENAEELAIDREGAERIIELVRQLPTAQQDALKLVAVLGYSNTEAAQLLGITPNAVALRVFKAKKRLASLMDGYLLENTEGKARS